MLRPDSAGLRTLVWLHRWGSVLTCLLFAMWFASGAVMLFEPFPALSDPERARHAEPIDLGGISLEPAAAVRRVPGASSLRLVSRDAQPVYLAGDGLAPEVAIDARSGALLRDIDAAAAGRIAARFAGARVRRVIPDVRYDQWIVHQGFDSDRPYYRVEVDDAARTELYIAARTGEVRQRTTRHQRVLNWGGAVVHWIYFTPVRKHWSAWDRLVWWVSLVAFCSATIGMVLGVYRFVQGRRARGRGFDMYRRWLRWHHVLGVCAGVFLLCWMGSGWLSMDHNRLFSVAGVDPGRRARFEGGDLQHSASSMSLQALQSLREGRYSEVQFRVVQGLSFVVTRSREGSSVLLSGEAAARGKLPAPLLRSAVAAAWPETQVDQARPGALQDFYGRAEEVPSGVVGFTLQEADRPARLLFVDSARGEMVAVLDASRRRYAWLYYGMHTWRLPGLYAHETLRESLMLVVLAAGFLLSITGVVLGVRRLGKRR